MSKTMTGLGSRALRKARLLFEQSYLFIRSNRGKFINIGCDKEIRNGWINIDSENVNPNVMSLDITTAAGLHELYQMSACIIKINHVIDNLSWKETLSILEACFLILKCSGKVIIEFTDKSKKFCDERQAKIDCTSYKSYSDSAGSLYQYNIAETSQIDVDKEESNTTWTAEKLSYILVSLGFSTISIEELAEYSGKPNNNTCIVAYKAALH